MAFPAARSSGVFSPRRYAHIVGWGMAAPEQIMTNDDLATFVDTSDAWIRSRTGIRERRIASDRESTTTLATAAARAALERADLLPVELDLIIVATSTPENIFPSTASLVQDALGATRAGAFDLSAACSGFVYALDMAAQGIITGQRETVMVIGAETMSRVLDWNDRSTCILFGDGAGAVILQGSQEYGGILASVLRSDGAGSDLLVIPTVGSEDLHRSGRHSGLQPGKMIMAGGEVFKFATRVVSSSIEQVSLMAGWSLGEINLVIPHQANLRILQSASDKLGIDLQRFFVNVDRYGNTSAASIPIALCEALDQGRIHDDDRLILVGFGGGLTWATMAIEWGIPEPVRRQPKRINRQRRQVQYWLARLRAGRARWQRGLNRQLRRLRRSLTVPGRRGDQPPRA